MCVCVCVYIYIYIRICILEGIEPSVYGNLYLPIAPT